MTPRVVVADTQEDKQGLRKIVNYNNGYYDPYDDYYYDAYYNGYYYDSDYYRNRSTSSQSSTATSSAKSESAGSDRIQLEERVPREVMLEAVRLGQSEIVTLKNYQSVSADSLRAAAKLGDSAVCFQTMDAERVVGSITLTPSIIEPTFDYIRLGVYSETGNTKTVQDLFNARFKNKVRVILCDEEHFPSPVHLSVYAGDLSGANVYFYTYDAPSNQYQPFVPTSPYKDPEGYLHFTTAQGGYILVSDGPLQGK